MNPKNGVPAEYAEIIHMIEKYEHLKNNTQLKYMEDDSILYIQINCHNLMTIWLVSNLLHIPLKFLSKEYITFLCR